MSREAVIRARALAAGIPEERAAGLAEAIVLVFAEPPKERPWKISPPTAEGQRRLARALERRATPPNDIPYLPNFAGAGEPESCALCGDATLYRTSLPERSTDEQVPICPKCAKAKTPADVPAKAGVAP